MHRPQFKYFKGICIIKYFIGICTDLKIINMIQWCLELDHVKASNQRKYKALSTLISTITNLQLMVFYNLRIENFLILNPKNAQNIPNTVTFNETHSR